MPRATQKRAKQGVTKLIVLDALIRLHTQGGKRRHVSRVELLDAVSLPETTVDDRLRTMLKEGRVLRVDRGSYVPVPWPGQMQLHAELPGTRKIVIFPNGTVVKMVWESGTDSTAPGTDRAMRIWLSQR